MAQFLTPISDILNADGWTTEPLWSKVNDGSDATFISSPAGTNPNTRITLGNSGIMTPTGFNFIFRVRARKSASGGQDRRLNITLTRNDGTTIITKSTPNLTDSFTTYELTDAFLGYASEDWTNTRLIIADARVSGGQGRGVEVAWIEVETEGDAVIPEFIFSHIID